MPKFNLNISGVDQDAAQGRQEWGGPMPPKGSYPAKLKLVQVKQIKGKTDNRLSIMVTLNTGDEYDGCPVWGGVNLTDQGIPFVNQFLQALTDGTDSEFTAVKKAFYAGFVVDEKKTNVLKIGKYKINSPDGELPIMVSVGHSTYEGTTRPKISSFLLRNGGTSGSTVTDDDEVAEEDDDVEVSVDSDDGGDQGGIFDDEDGDE